ncbi:MAG: ABC-F type ribosomal protection protein [Erysipelotrichaceae bacterium]|nr:ABC-F type ribosomal protection protein [Erysipelotrichaceae bacterium]
MLLQVRNGTKDFAGEILFENIQFEIKENKKIAIIGRNGCGKTTLLKIISGLLPLDGGTLTKSANATIGYLAQMAFEDESLTVREEFNKVFAELLAIKQQLDELGKRLESEYDDENLIRQYDQLQHRFEAGNGYNYNQEQIALFTRFGFPIEDLDRPLNTFSGGQKTRIAFVKLLLMKPDILLLDEPTNHLDITTIEWLEDYLRKYPKAIVIVSHDRMFMDKIVSEVYEFEFGKLNHFTGNYTSYVAQKKILVQQQMRRYKNQQEEIERLSALIEKFRYKKEKAAFAQSKIKYLDRMERVERPREDKANFKLRFDPKIKGGTSVLTVDNLTIGYDKPLCTVSFQITNGQKLAIIGPNGLGKSTLVKTLMGMVEPLGGEYMFGHQIEAAYFDQQLAQFSTSRTVLEEVWDEHPELDHTAVRKVLGQFMFTADDVFKSCDVLSGGEKVRLSLAKLMLQQPNLLVLDEPTNHLDIMGKEALEDALQSYTGTLIFVSHDRYFIQKLATCILCVEGDKTAFYPLNYDEYMEKDHKPIISEKPAEEKKPVSQAKQQRENVKKTAQLERMITRAERELEELREKRFDPEYYHDNRKMDALEEAIDEKHNEIAHLMEEWEEYAATSADS